MEFWLLASTKAAFGNKVITKETCSHFFVVWVFYLTFFLHPLAFYLYMFLFVWHFWIHHRMSGCNKAIIRWMDEEMTGIQTIQVFHFLCSWSFNSSLNLYLCSYQDLLLEKVDNSFSSCLIPKMFSMIPIFTILISLFITEIKRNSLTFNETN